MTDYESLAQRLETMSTAMRWAVLGLVLGVLGGCAAGDAAPAGEPTVVNARVPARQAVVRDADGTIHRSLAARRAFQHRHPCPATGQSTGACPGWVVDHVVPLACGGADSPANMQWQTREAARGKDRWERQAPGCR
jgi:hypothetical protein